MGLLLVCNLLACLFLQLSLLQKVKAGDGCCDEIELHTNRQGNINNTFLYTKTWEKKMLDTYTKRPIYAIKLSDTENYEQHFLYWIGKNNNEMKDKNGAWMISTKIGANVGIVMKTLNDAMCPNNAMKEAWKYWDKDWKSDVSLTISCKDRPIDNHKLKQNFKIDQKKVIHRASTSLEDTRNNAKFNDPSKGKWYLARVNQNCADACNSHNLECLEDEFHKHNSEIDTSDKLIRVIRSFPGDYIRLLGGIDECKDDYLEAADVPNLSTEEDLCYFSGPTRSPSSFDCNVLAGSPVEYRKQRICWCQKAACTANARCSKPEVCKTNRYCGLCVTDADCSFENQVCLNKVKTNTANECGLCVSDADCSVQNEVCLNKANSNTANECGLCVSDADCSEPNEVCLIKAEENTANKCGRCVADADCSEPNEVCLNKAEQNTANKCGLCVADADCLKPNEVCLNKAEQNTSNKCVEDSTSTTEATTTPTTTTTTEVPTTKLITTTTTTTTRPLPTTTEPNKDCKDKLKLSKCRKRIRQCKNKKWAKKNCKKTCRICGASQGITAGVAKKNTKLIGQTIFVLSYITRRIVDAMQIA